MGNANNIPEPDLLKLSTTDLLLITVSCLSAAAEENLFSCENVTYSHQSNSCNAAPSQETGTPEATTVQGAQSLAGAAGDANPPMAEARDRSPVCKLSIE